MAIIELKEYTKKFRKFEAVKDLSFSVEAGEIVGFVGKNGAGKSTTLRGMVNMIFPTKGSIEILGMDSVKQTKAIKKNLSYVPSEPSYPKNLRSMTLLKFCQKFTTTRLDEIQEMGRYFELDLTKKIGDLSLGNLKKLALIQALLKKADVILLDEPTSGLDPFMQKRFFEYLLQEKKRGATIFLSSHNLSEIEKYCDRVAVIRDGELVEFLDMDKVQVHHKQMVTIRLKNGQEFFKEYEGDINALIANLANMDIANLEIKNKTVEEEFISYYVPEGGNN